MIDEKTPGGGGDLIHQRRQRGMAFRREIAPGDRLFVGRERSFSFAHGKVQEAAGRQFIEGARHVEIVHRECRERGVAKMGAPDAGGFAGNEQKRQFIDGELCVGHGASFLRHRFYHTA
jgi:hypothetical protein